MARAVEAAGPVFRRTQDINGGLKRELLRPIACTLAGVRAGSSPGGAFADQELDAVVPQLATAVSVQAGRGWTNNGALLAVLAAAANSDVNWLVLAVPEFYKNGVQRVRVQQQLEALSASSGIALDLGGVWVSGY